MSQSKITPKPLPIVDPIFAAIAEQKALEKEFYRLDRTLDDAKFEAQKTHGKGPADWIWWRHRDVYSEEHLDIRRDEFLRQPGDREQLEKEYQDAKERLAVAVRSAAEWDQRAGIAPLSEQRDRTNLAERRACMRMARTKPTTPAGAAALTNYALREIAAADIHLTYWHATAIRTATAALIRMSEEATQ